MLFAKDLKVALAAVIAAVGLLGFNVAHATVFTTPEEGETSDVVYFAAEAYPAILPAPPSQSGGVPKATSTHNYDVADNLIDVLLQEGGDYYIRFDLTGGAEFAADPAAPAIHGFLADGSNTAFNDVPTRRARQGQQGDTVGIWTFRVRVEGAISGGDIADGVNAGSWRVGFGLGTEGVRFPRNVSATGRTCFNVILSIWDDFGDARAANVDGGDLADAASALQAGKATLACFLPTVSAAFAMPQTLTASVASDFRRFLGATPTMGTLGTATVTVKKTEGTRDILNPADAEKITAADVLKRVSFTFDEAEEGIFTHSRPFEFGEFKLGAGGLARYGSDGTALTAAVAATAMGKANTATVRGSAGEGTHAFTVNVAGNLTAAQLTAAQATDADAMNPYSQIGAGQYSAKWLIVLPNDATTGAGMSANAGKIQRDGTTVRVGYLTTATEFGSAGRGHNQRLVISNHGTIDSEVTLREFVVEDGATVPEPWTMVVEGGQQVVVKVADILTIGGCRVDLDDDGECPQGYNRTAATFTAAARGDQISVFTTTVTLPEGQTDTVRYWPLQ